jgi:hypothetical protein
MATEHEDAERFKTQLEEQRKASTRTVYVAIVAASAGVLGGATPEIIKQVAEEKPKYQLVVVQQSLDAKTPVGVYRFDSKSGQVTYVKRREDGTTEWVMVPDSHGSIPKSAPTSAPATSNPQSPAPTK